MPHFLFFVTSTQSDGGHVPVLHVAARPGAVTLDVGGDRDLVQCLRGPSTRALSPAPGLLDFPVSGSRVAFANRDRKEFE